MEEVTQPARLHCHVCCFISFLLALFQPTLKATQQLVAQSCSTAMNHILNVPHSIPAKQSLFRKWLTDGKRWVVLPSCLSKKALLWPAIPNTCMQQCILIIHITVNVKLNSCAYLTHVLNNI